MVTYQARPLTDAVIAALTAEGLTVGDGEKPATAAGWAGAPGMSVFREYVVVHPIGAAEIDGSNDDPDDDVWPIYQLSSFGAHRAQCEAIADKARVALLDADLVIPGRAVARMRIEFLGGSIRFDSPQPPIYMNADRFTAYTTPT